MMSFLTCFFIAYIIPSCSGNLPLDDYSKKSSQTNIDVDCNNESELVKDAIKLTVDFTDSSKRIVKYIMYGLWQTESVLRLVLT